MPKKQIDTCKNRHNKGQKRNSINLTEGEDIKKRWQEYTEELYEKDFNDPDNHDGVTTYLRARHPEV